MQTMSEKIKALYEYLCIPQAEVARRLNMSAQTFSNRLKRNSWHESDLYNIADVLNVDLLYGFRVRGTEKEF